MKTYALIAALALALPGIAEARKVTYYSDRDGDGHYVKRSKNVNDCYRGGYYGGSAYYGRSSYYGRPYYSSGYRPYYYGRPYATYGVLPAITFSYTSSSSRYYRPSTAYRSTRSTLETDVQVALKRRGYYAGAIDGDIGPGTRAAIRSYQADRGLRTTGRIDSSLLRSLGI